LESAVINIIELPSNLGLMEKSGTADEPGVGKLPDRLREFKFHSLIDPDRTFRLEPPPYSMKMDHKSRVRNADSIVRYAKQQLGPITDGLNRECFLLIIGGDCSIIIGNAVALRQKGNYGLFFLDGHTDFIGPELSQTGGAAGMDLAIVAGHGHDELTNINGLKPYFEERNIFCVGNREYNEDYVRPILESEIEYVNLESLRQKGMANTALQFLHMVERRKLDGFLVHLDVDVLNDTIMPAVDSRQPDGLTYKELSDLLVPLLCSQQAIGMEITILDPDLDPHGRYTELFVDNFVEIFKKGKSL